DGAELVPIALLAAFPAGLLDRRHIVETPPWTGVVVLGKRDPHLELIATCPEAERSVLWSCGEHRCVTSARYAAPPPEKLGHALDPWIGACAAGDAGTIAPWLARPSRA